VRHYRVARYVDVRVERADFKLLACIRFGYLHEKITVHLSPSDKRKTGTGYDAAMLLAVLREMIEEPIPIRGRPPRTKLFWIFTTITYL